jgi:hypothetical protein
VLDVTDFLRRWRSLGLAALALFLLAGAVVVPHVATYVTLSPIDELQHIDYVVKASHLHEVRPGEKVGETAMREQSCRGIDSPGFVSPPCDAEVLAPEMYQEAGYNTAAVHPPPYYTLTGLAARVITPLIGSSSIVTGARLVGALWLGLGLLLTFVLARSLGASAPAAFAGAGVLATLPVVVFSSATVTPDATAMLSGSVVCLATVRYLQGRAGPRTLLAGALVATAFKVTGVLAIGICALVLLMSAWASRREEDASADGGRRSLIGLLILAGGGSAPVLLWMAVSRVQALDVPPSPMSRFIVHSLAPSQVLGNLVALAPPTQNAYLAPGLRTALVMALVAIGGYLVLGGVGAVALSRSGQPLVDRLGIATLTGMLTGGPVLVVMTYVLASVYVPIPSRYGLVLLPPAIAVLAALGSRSRGVLVGIVAVAVVQGAALVMAWV